MIEAHAPLVDVGITKIALTIVEKYLIESSVRSCRLAVENLLGQSQQRGKMLETKKNGGVT